MGFNPIISAQGADGYMVFFTGPSAIAGDNDIFWDRANNRLGIGTSTPTHKVQVQGDIAVAQTGKIAFDTAENAYMESISSGVLDFYTNSRKFRLTTTSAAFSNLSGGVNVPSPAYLFSSNSPLSLGTLSGTSQGLGVGDVFVSGAIEVDGYTYLDNHAGIAGILDVGQRLLLPQANTPASPTIAFGDGNTGIYENLSDSIAFALNGSQVMSLFSGQLLGSDPSFSPNVLMNSAGSSTVPSYRFRGDTNTGLGRADVDQLSLIAGGIEGLRITGGGPGQPTVDAYGYLQTHTEGHILTLGKELNGSSLIESSLNSIKLINNNISFTTSGLTLNSGLSITTQRIRWSVGPLSLGNTNGTSNHGLGSGATIFTGGAEFNFPVYFDSTLDAYGDLQIHATNRLILPSVNDGTNPTLTFGDGDTGIYEISDDLLGFRVGGTLDTFTMDDTTITLRNNGRLAFQSTTTGHAFVTSGSSNEFKFGMGTQFGRQLVITDITNVFVDHGHVEPTNPTVFLHSVTAPGTDPNEYLLLTHNQSDGYISSGKGVVDFGVGINVPYGITSGNNVTITPATDGYLEVDGYIIPATDNVDGLGTPDRRWADVYVGPGSIRQVSKSTDGIGQPDKTFSWTVGADGKLRLNDNDITVAVFDSGAGAEFPAGGGGGEPGGLDTHVQFNDGAAFGGESTFIWNKTADRLGIGGAPSFDLHVTKSVGGGTVTAGVYNNSATLASDARITAFASSSSNGQAYMLLHGGGNTPWTINASGTNSGDLLFGAFATPASTTRMRLTRAGSLMIGAGGSPGAVLQVSGDAIVNTGLSVGHTGTPTDDTVSVGDDVFGLNYDGGNPFVYFDATSQITYNRGSAQYQFGISGTDEATIDASGMTITNGLSVGHTGTPVDNRISVGDTNFYLQHGTSPELRFDVNDVFSYNRSTNRYQWWINGGLEMQVTTTGAIISDGLSVGHTGTPVNDRVSVGDANFFMLGGTFPAIYFDSNDNITYSRSLNQWSWNLAGTTAVKLNSFGIGIGIDPAQAPNNAIHLGDSSGIWINIGTANTPSLTGVSGGTLGAGTYYYRIEARDLFGGPGVTGPENSITINGTTQTAILLSWFETGGAAEYKIYKGTSSGVYTDTFFTGGPATTFVDDGTSGFGGSAINTVSLGYSAQVGSTAAAFPKVNIGVDIFDAKLGIRPDPGDDAIVIRSIGEDGYISFQHINDSGDFTPSEGNLGVISFQGFNGGLWEEAAKIVGATDSYGAIDTGFGDMPGRLEFYTTPDGYGIPLERMRITSEGFVGIGVTSPQEELNLAAGSTIAINMAVPENIFISSAGPGSLTGTYYYVVTALDGLGGETVASEQVSYSPSAENVFMDWDDVPGASNYRVYRGTSSGSHTEYQETFGNSDFTDGFGGFIAGEPPTETTAYKEKIGGSPTYFLENVGIGHSNPTSTLFVNDEAGGFLGSTEVVIRTNSGQAAAPFKIEDDILTEQFTVGTSGAITTRGNISFLSNSPTITDNSTGGNLTISVKGGSNANPHARVFQQSNFTHTSGTNKNLFQLINTFAPTSGSVDFSTLRLITTVNQSGSASGTIRGIHIDSTVNNAVDWRAIHINDAGIDGHSIYSEGGDALFLQGSVETQPSSEAIATDNTPATTSIGSVGAGTITDYIGQAFTADGINRITSLEVWVRTNAAPHEIYVSIWEALNPTSGNPDPTKVLWTGEKITATVGNPGSAFIFTGLNIPVIPGNKYYVMFDGDSNVNIRHPDLSGSVGIGKSNNPTNFVENIIFSNNSGGSWSFSTVYGAIDVRGDMGGVVSSTNLHASHLSVSSGDITDPEAIHGFKSSNTVFFGAANSENGPHWSAYTDETAGWENPVFQQLNWRHDDIEMHFDNWWDARQGQQKASDASVYSIAKSSDLLQIWGSTGNTVGGVATIGRIAAFYGSNNGLSVGSSAHTTTPPANGIVTTGGVSIGGTGEYASLSINDAIADIAVLETSSTPSATSGYNKLYVENEQNQWMAFNESGRKHAIQGGMASSHRNGTASSFSGGAQLRYWLNNEGGVHNVSSVTIPANRMQGQPFILQSDRNINNAEVIIYAVVAGGTARTMIYDTISPINHHPNALVWSSPEYSTATATNVSLGSITVSGVMEPGKVYWLITWHNAGGSPGWRCQYIYGQQGILGRPQGTTTSYNMGAYDDIAYSSTVPTNISGNAFVLSSVYAPGLSCLFDNTY